MGSVLGFLYSGGDMRRGTYNEYTGVHNVVTACGAHRASGYPSTTSSTIITEKPAANMTVPRLECAPCDISGISSSTTT